MSDTFFTPLPERALIRLTGEETQEFLQGLITQNVENLAPGEAAFAALLTPQGKILFDFFVIGTEDGVLIDCLAQMQEALIKRLKMYRLRAKIEIAGEPDLKVGALFAKESEASLTTIDAIACYLDPRLSTIGKRIIFSGAVPEVAGANPATAEDYHAHRIALGVAEIGADFDSDDTFPLDVNYDALNGVDYKKGCFVGQEVASRMKRKGEVRKRTVIISSSDPLNKNADIMAGEGSIGRVLSSSGKQAIGLVRLDRLDKARKSSTPLNVGGASINIDQPLYLGKLNP